MLATNSTHNEVWQNCLDLIRQQTSQEEFAKWFLPINPLEFNGTILRICVPNASYVNEIEKKYMQMIRPIIAQVYGPQTRLYYAIPKQESSTATSADTTAIPKFNTPDSTNIKNPFIIPGMRKMVIDPQLNPHYTFDNFIEGECNRLARSAGMAIAVNPGNDTPFNQASALVNTVCSKLFVILV